MSHFTTMKTSFCNLSHLEKALANLNISYKKSQNYANEFSYSNLTIPQLNGYDIQFDWNGREYNLIVDMSFWEQPYPIENFIDKIAQEYATEVILSESQRIGFQPILYKQNKDGSNTIIVERWNNQFTS